MEKTKEKILYQSLRLFAQKGYNGVSMRDIAGQLGITQGALYRHYSGKQDIFDSILRRMEEYDRQYAERSHLPANVFAESPESYKNISDGDIIKFTIEMFQYWTENEFASAFRKMLTMEQYHSMEMSNLYQQYFGKNVLVYLVNLFRENGHTDAEIKALRFYGPFYFLLNQYDASDNKSEFVNLLKKSLS